MSTVACATWPFVSLSRAVLERASDPQYHVRSDSAIVDTTAFTSERTHATLPDFITTSQPFSLSSSGSCLTCDGLSAACPTLASRIAQRPKHHAAPTAIVLAGAALRVADLTRVIRPLKGESGGEIAKVRWSVAIMSIHRLHGDGQAL